MTDSDYQARILDLLHVIDSPVVHWSHFLITDALTGRLGHIDYGAVDDAANNVRLSTGERAICRLALMFNAERQVGGWDFLAELAHLDAQTRAVALAVLTP